MAEIVLPDFALEAIECDRQARGFWKEKDRLVERVYKEATGHDMPQLVTFRDMSGALWAINVYVDLKRVEKGVADAGSD